MKKTDGKSIKKNIRVLAYTNLNFGDDMFVYTLSHVMPNVHLVLEAPSVYKEVYKDCENITIKKVSRLQRVKRAVFSRISIINKYVISRYDAIVYVVGALFDDNDIWKEYIDTYGLNKIKKSLWRYFYNEKTPFFLLGCNMTNVRSHNYIEQMKYMFDGLTDICFRDNYSYGYFKELPNVRCAPDIVFNYNCNNTKKREKSILISIWGPLTVSDDFPQMKWAEEFWDDYKEFIIKISKYYLTLGYKVEFVSFCKNEGDENAANIILSEGGLSDVIPLFCYNGNIKEVISLFERSQFVVGTRFHSIVMGINANCVVYPIIYESKTEQLLNDIKYDGLYTVLSERDTYNIDRVINTFNSKKIIDSSIVKKAAANQFKVINDYVIK
ncbi:polysaccharide pyruvyl transferase family protein [Pseudobutyrivibrio xylanivorans]|uniref:Polysaccharide pyruvyl transferase n=1 Tax=Pseudobutyrivibrio xylanivorans DSM 14809 TaxID=1123012 RepID=A0A1M6KNI2_PSEXY|nr:polysaccharide pyruvyl transferase family protein [Pseudobutyrivibrio xylanivorans]SHJ60444.1 Polysaccharide pyruvyl transferase [Pseudobutyrivibrio xylanivorans DSM 14809]